jgi:hypothetical protein
LAALTAYVFLSGAVSSADTIQLKVLYAGNPGSERAKDFVSFLEKHFAKVGSVEFGKFKEPDAKDYDVVIFDWTSIYPRDKTGKIDNAVGSIRSPTSPRLSKDFARASILIGAAGGQVGQTRKIKIDWL